MNIRPISDNARLQWYKPSQSASDNREAVSQPVLTWAILCPVGQLRKCQADKRGAPPNYLLDRISEALGLPEEYPRFVAGRLPADLAENYHREHDPETVKAAFKAFRKTPLAEGPGESRRL